uniref:t-SNARE coiled-coil homology domain-containing protein n=1 Tax=Pyramimonas obovata TaxID=1411642 RepID=A0A7S0N8C7_9CHLO|mmetsp:Transcript_22799/g.49987  ORF Transcript_22799/g.49987 Transcript_22799/m.49987 type:complete len:290 (+) Transcript_22799:405-1274(+)|eukprot:CAMPEP_0118924546 /NCGR_PEP_ID=MMETSP1169-20130426/2635_1 /TAXON_ID=36882 /ORGANISM="Pyramimonas obovata, Strain CCMP722" /LENGTH=289 /DNA_ID=CAMNT_0006865673 /DNA_START=405 /DNA_END=1274 /DNA_ORIENTATION=+
MDIYDIETRIGTLVNKYKAYDDAPKKERPLDAFEDLYFHMEGTIDSLHHKAEEVQLERNRGGQAANAPRLNAEIRRGKAQLLQDLPKLLKLAKKKGKSKGKPKTDDQGSSLRQSKGIDPQELEERHRRIADLEARIQEIPDGVLMSTNGDKKKSNILGLNNIDIRIDAMTEASTSRDPSYYEHTEESRNFKNEFEMAKARQDESLDEISKGVDTLRNLAGDMSEEIGKQEDLVSTMEQRMDTVNTEMRSVNARLKQTLFSVRSSRDLCMDVTLICILLGIGAYIYNQLK